MKIFDVNGNPMENPDLEKGRLERSYKPITYHYEITQKEVGHYEVVKEYPNGGKDVEWVIDIPEKGYWATYDKDGNKIETDVIIPVDAPHEMDFNDFEEIFHYIPYTEEELEELNKEPEPTTDEVLNVLLGIGGEA